MENESEGRKSEHFEDYMLTRVLEKYLNGPSSTKTVEAQRKPQLGQILCDINFGGNFELPYYYFAGSPVHGIIIRSRFIDKDNIYDTIVLLDEFNTRSRNNILSQVTKKLNLESLAHDAGEQKSKVTDK